MLTADAKREQEENAAEKGRIENERERFELIRDKLYLVIGLALIGFLLIAAAALWLSGQESSALYLVGSTGIGGVIIYLLRRRGESEDKG